MGGYGSGKGIRPNRHHRKRFSYELLRLDSFVLPSQLKKCGWAISSVTLDSQLCHFGGSRVFWRCPLCQNRFRYLYYHNRSVGCRKCFHLAYKSQNETLADRLLRKRNKVREKMVGDAYAGKPAGMRWVTYNQLVSKALEYESLAVLAFTTSARKLQDLTSSGMHLARH